MKSLLDYLVESAQQFEYRIKIAGEITDEQIQDLEKNFAKFDLISLSEPKRTPVMQDPIGFNGLKNEEINIMDAVFNYPASTEQFAEIAKQVGIESNKIVVINKAFNDSMNDEEDNKERAPEGSSLLGSDLPDSTQAQLDASKAYGTSGDEQDVIKNRAKTNFEVAGGETPKAQTTNDLPMGTDSPFSNVKLPERPKTGAK